MARIEARLKKGAQDPPVGYGDASLDRPLTELITEQMEELEDTVGWCFPQWVKLRALKERMEKLEVEVMRRTELEITAP